MPLDPDERFCPCAVCAVLNPTSVAPAQLRIDLALAEGTLRLHLCAVHDAYAQRVAGFLVPVPASELEATTPQAEEAEKEEDFGTDRDTL